MCFNPVRIRTAQGFREYGCGHCSQCLKAYQDGWIARLSEELKQWKPVVQDKIVAKPVIFFTLDYSPEAVPCSYLVVTDCGVYRSDARPEGVPVLPFWSDRTMESASEWFVRRKRLLRMYASQTMRNFYEIERKALPEDVRNGHYKNVTVRTGFDKYGRLLGYHAESEFMTDLPETYEPEFVRFGESTLDYPKYDFQVLQTQPGCGTSLFAIEFHTVSKHDVQGLLKRARRQLEYTKPSVFGCGQNPRQETTWFDSDGKSRKYPSSSLTATFKYFITSEYGPETFRPHYHGVVFGLTYDEFKNTIARDWESKGYGRCDFSVFDPSRGAFAYLGKYCSKGHYEHPLCCKHFVYPSGKEFHSNKYELSLATFGVNAPLVCPTFHLISKGIGACYAFQSEIQHLFGVQLSSFLTPSGSLKYACSDAREDIKNVRPFFNLDQLMAFNPEELTGSSVRVKMMDNGDVRVRRYDSGNNVIGESLIKSSSIINTALEESIAHQMYTRSYVTQEFKGKTVPGRCLPCWHKIGLTRICNPVQKSTFIPLPRYYRNFLVSPLASILRQSFAKRVHPSLDEVRARLVQQGRPEDEVSSLVCQLVDSQEDRNTVTSRRLHDAARDFYFANKHPKRLM